MTVIGDANTLLSWACATMTADGTDCSAVAALLPVARVADLPAVWSEMPAIDLAGLVAADTRARTVVKRLMRLASAARARKLAGT